MTLKLPSMTHPLVRICPPSDLAARVISAAFIPAARAFASLNSSSYDDSALASATDCTWSSALRA